jgi:tetratricopeptide (TPR) repeat protein
MSDRRQPFPRNGGEHPDAEQLAEYADHVLAPAVREDVERHLAGCTECRTVLVDTMAYLDENARPRWRRRVIGVAAGLATAAVLVLAIRTIQPDWLGLKTEAPEVRQLTTAITNEPTRPLEGRLAGDFPYAPAPSVVRGTSLRGPSDPTVPPDLRIAAAALEKMIRERETADRAATLGVAYAATGDLDRAVASLQRAVEREPANARYLSNLAAMHLARARSQNRPGENTIALRLAERAVAADATLSEACFNWALALEQLSRDGARQAWEKCLAAESDPAWSAEIRDRIKKLTP